MGRQGIRTPFRRAASTARSHVHQTPTTIASSGLTPSDDLDATLSDMAFAISAVKLEQLSVVRASRGKRVAARKSIEAMVKKLKELDEFIQ